MKLKRIDIKMKMRQVLSIEQMKHLQELGVDTSDASMCWLDFEDNEPMEVAVFVPQIMLGYATCKIYPTYTIGDLIEKLPNCNSAYEFQVTIRNHFTESICKQNKVMEDYITSHNPINALYRALCIVAEYFPQLLEVKK